MTSPLSFVWLEVTGKCQLTCAHCYADSGPRGTHGNMKGRDWLRVINEAAALGVQMVQFIGGEPTMHPELPDLVNGALASGLGVEVYSNLVHVRQELWETFEQPGVRLATSYYSDERSKHETITKRRGSYSRTKANVIEALRRSIPIRVGIVETHDDQRVEQARAELESLGVTDIGSDRLRQVGRGIRDQAAGLAQLCGNCAFGVLAVSPHGFVWPCVFSRWLSIGNVRDSSLTEILAGSRLSNVRRDLVEHFQQRPTHSTFSACNPDCNPHCNPCNPGCSPYNAPCNPACSPSCSPTCNPTNCRPRCLP